jgi:hypothetical protein
MAKVKIEQTWPDGDSLRCPWRHPFLTPWPRRGPTPGRCGPTRWGSRWRRARMPTAEVDRAHALILATLIAVAVYILGLPWWPWAR